MTINIDLQNYKHKKELLKKLSEIIPDMYGMNYDALIDSATFYNEPITLEFENLSAYEDGQNLVEVLEIINTENKKFQYVIKN